MKLSYLDHEHEILISIGNHTAYKQVKGRKVPAEEIKELYEGLKQSDLVNFDMMITGYTASKEAVNTVATIGRDLKFRSTTKPGSFFWGTCCLTVVLHEDNAK